ncbi:MAG: surface lipoprotein assembly modifier, partial [Candidatus Adiutrix sp.]|nr:surface lipoprotein assembly modifier [Candidatus Adiutrix sp.]
GRFRLGFNYDSNANQGPASEDMQLGSWRVTVPGAKSIPTAAAYFGANFDLLRPLDQSPWALVGDLGLNLRVSENSDLDASRTREWQALRLAGGLRRIGPRDLLDLRLKAEIFDYEFTNSVLAAGPELAWLHAFTPSLQLVSNLGLEQRAYKRDSGRNGLYGQAGETLRFFFGGQGRHNFSLGGGFLWGEPSEKNYQYTGWTAPARLSLGLTDRLNLSPHVSYTRESYRGPATALETEDRRDDRVRAGLDTSFRLTESLSLEVNYAYTNSDSNSPLYSYDQHLVGLGLAWGF